MPQMGESVTEGTVLEWLKAVGDRVEADEPLVEISTDKVDAEVPAPAAGILTKIHRRVGRPRWRSARCSARSRWTATARPPPRREAEARSSCDVLFPEMGDSVTEGTVLEWKVAPGDAVAVDDPLVEISTDKVDADLPSPVAGTIAEILVEPDATVAVGTVLCRIAAGAGAARRRSPQRSRTRRTPAPTPRRQRRRERDPRRAPHGNRARDRPRIGQGQRPARAGDQGGRAGRAGRRRSTRARPERHRVAPDPRARGHARPLHGREPLDPHRHQLPHAPGRRARRPPRASSRRPAASSASRT